MCGKTVLALNYCTSSRIVIMSQLNCCNLILEDAVFIFLCSVVLMVDVCTSRNAGGRIGKNACCVLV